MGNPPTVAQDLNGLLEPRHADRLRAEPGRQQRRKEESHPDILHAYHDKVTDARRDIRDIPVYFTPPLEKPLTFAGPLSAVLYASSSAQDTDWFVTLAEVDKDNKIFTLAQGKFRARFRRSMAKPELLQPG
ncbi:MAG: hypothetical protein HY013_11050, partial [Candidatus Solibacter usitatus]|nr:hypothetical protein [Candidatus Solibacter usitatus]